MTLLEIMIVLAILAGVMGLIIGPRVIAAFQDSRKSLAKLGIEKLQYEAYPQWRIANMQKRCPGSIAELGTTRETVDPWGTPYAVTCPPLAIASAGEDGQLNTDDDIK
jgi:type II secretory pathway pseudopilin PulG